MLSDQGQNLMTNNELSIHIESADIFYQNFNTNENFYNFLMTQQNDETANVPKRISYHHSFENYVKNFLPLFSLDDVDKFDLYSNKNAKYLFYRFNDFIKKSGGKKQIIKHTLKIKDSVSLKKFENKNRQFLVKKIIHCVEFQNPYENSVERKPEIIETVEKNYKIIRRVYQCLFTEVAEIFLKYVHSLVSDEIQQLDDGIKNNGWGFINNILEMDNPVELLSAFQLFYHKNSRLPLTNGLIVVPDGDVPEGEQKINFKNLYKMSRYTKFHGLVSVQFLGVLSIFFGTDPAQIKNTISELYRNLSYTTLSGANDINFDEMSDLISALNFFIKKIILVNRNRKEKEGIKNEQEIIDSTTFVPLPDPFEEDLTDDQFENDLEHKKNRTSLC